jgi:hypothetical protein
MEAVYYRNRLPWWLKYHFNVVGALPAELIEYIERKVMREYLCRHRGCLEWVNEDFLVKTVRVRKFLDACGMEELEVSNCRDLLRLRKVRFNTADMLEYYRRRNGSWVILPAISKLMNETTEDTELVNVSQQTSEHQSSHKQQNVRPRIDRKSRRRLRSTLLHELG